MESSNRRKINMKKITLILVCFAVMLVPVVFSTTDTSAQSSCAEPGYISSNWCAPADCWSNAYRSTCWAPWQRIPLPDQGADVDERRYYRPPQSCDSCQSHYRGRSPYDRPGIGQDWECEDPICRRITPYPPMTVNGTDGTTIQRFCYPRPMCQNQIPYEDFRKERTQTYVQERVRRTSCTPIRNYLGSRTPTDFSDVYQPILGTTIKQFLECIKGTIVVEEPREDRSYTFCPTQGSITRAGVIQIRREGVISPELLFRLVG